MSGTVFKGYVCPKCKWSDFFQTKNCPRCQTETQEVSFSGAGKLATFTVIRYPPEGFEKDTPYVVGLVDLDEGPRVIGRITANPDQLRISQQVRYTGNVNGSLHFKTAD